MVDKLIVRYPEDLMKNQITGEIYRALKTQGIMPLEIVSNYAAKMGVFEVKYFFSKKESPKLSLLEGILNNANLLEKVEIITNKK